MSIEKRKASIRNWFEAFHIRDLNRLDQLADEYCASDYVLHHPTFTDLAPGPEGVKQFVRRVFKNWERSPDVCVIVDDLIAEGDKLAARYTVYNSPNPSTGELTNNLHLAVFHFTDGKIAEAWEL